MPHTHKTVPDGTKLENGYTTGIQERPQFTYDDDFPCKSKEGTATLHDHLEWYKWGVILRASQVLRPDLDDANPMYAHYRGNTGTDQWVDYEEAYREDFGIRQNMDKELSQARQAAKKLTTQGYTDFTFQSAPRDIEGYPATFNWQKTLGDHKFWSTSEVRVENGVATMTVSIEAEDVWNFNRGAYDTETGTADEVNGRFQELGWARQFTTHGKIERTYTWNVDDPGTESQMPVTPSDPQRSEDGVLSGRSSGGIREDRNEPGGDGMVPNFEIRDPVLTTPRTRGQGKRE